MDCECSATNISTGKAEECGCMSCATGRARASKAGRIPATGAQPTRRPVAGRGRTVRPDASNRLTRCGNCSGRHAVTQPLSHPVREMYARDQIVASMDRELPRFAGPAPGSRQETSLSSPGDLTRHNIEPELPFRFDFWEGSWPRDDQATEDDGTICYPQDNVAVWASNVEWLSSRCTLDLGEMFLGTSGVTLRAQLPSGYQPRTLQQDMLKEFIPDYMTANRIDWSIIAKNVVANEQVEVPGCYWTDPGGVLHFAVLHALQMIAAGSLGNSLGLGAVQRFVAACNLIRQGDLEIILSAGGTADRSVLFVASDGRVACEWVGGDEDAPWTALTFTAIELAPVLVGSAALADYLLWWAWRLHSYWEETGRFDGNVYYTGLAAARLAFAEIAKIGSLILHECGHLPFQPGSQGAHCTDVWDNGLDCPQDVMEPMWLGRAAVLYNLPAPHTPEPTLDSVLDAAAREMASGGNPAEEADVWADITTVDLQLLFGNVWVELDGTRHVTGVSTVSVETPGSAGALEAHGSEGCPAGTFDVKITWRPTGTTAVVKIEIPEPCSSTGTGRTVSGMM